MKKIRLFLLTLTVVILAGALTVSCGKGDNSSGAPGSNTDVDSFFTDYSAFIDDYCTMADKYQGASLSEKTALLQSLGMKSLKLAEYSNKAIALKASMSSGSQEKLTELEKRTEECSKKFQAAQ